MTKKCECIITIEEETLFLDCPIHGQEATDLLKSEFTLEDETLPN